MVPGEEGEGEEEAPFEFPAVEDPDPYNLRSYLSKGGKVINERLSDAERAISKSLTCQLCVLSALVVDRRLSELLDIVAYYVC